MAAPSRRPPAPESLIGDFLARANPHTARAYRTALADFASHLKAGSAAVALDRLLRAGARGAGRLLEKYRLAMTGARDPEGQVRAGRGLGPATVNLRLVVLRSLLRHARKQGLIDWEAAVQGVRDERVHDVRGPSEEILNKMLRAARAKAGPEGARDYAILRLAGELALRRKEIVALDVGDFDPENLELRIHGKGKSQKQTVSCTPRTAEAVQRWLAVRPRSRSGQALFTNLIPGRGSRLSGSAVYAIVRALGKAALPSSSRKRISPHKLRHTSITSAVRRTRELGLSREEVRKFSRHGDMRMVNRYLDADDNAQAKIAKSVGDRLE